MTGPEKVSIKVPPPERDWMQLLGPEEVGISGAGDAFTVRLTNNSYVLWVR